MLANFLEMNNFRVLKAYDGKEALTIIQNHASDIHIAVLDIMVPYVDGKEICKKIREHPVLSGIPVIFLTARDKEKDEIEGLELGADDYIPKPASLKLVNAHVESLLRRRAPEKAHWLRYGSVFMDTVGKDLYKKEDRIDLTSTEYALAELFFKNPKMVYSRQQILEHIGDDDKFVF